ncbi:UDP-N-acetylglucosamine 1-carboxyvinyltransferase [Cohnella sp. CIP 111063]|uniref:UDP-N-acetylglucosamine 1-carboxyvinyltransferase n=1 Tax=unclassified Cohnella TaxID=2636738 RepID=UPI000B8BCDD8|nr:MULTISPECIES: UDP-N-acetylglucosamine 1-carboxyvinyltransferase [unclassified Cohnella]OXS57210.1 UDP-N-acetylglucosamine 1-carboxyvinyltransferase [Cohnella sp. CIP 111063]PRX70644.1 UDP-N-acetylglucosamine 1-carboxyvinyltransferase [Cohnella sp. SGD-V74]
MKQIVVNPGSPFGGAVSVPGSKNSSLALMAAACLSDEPVLLRGIPKITDLDVFSRIGEDIGLIIYRDEDNAVLIDPRGIRSTVVDPARASAFRTAYYFIGALLAKHGKVSMGYPGGDDFVSRPIDQHIKALMAMGAKFVFHTDYYEVECANLRGADIYFDTISSGATINAMLAAARATGRTTLRQAARDPEVVDTAQLLIKMGAKIRGAGSDTITIEGVGHLRGCTYTAIPDRLIAGAFLIAAGATNGIVTVNDVIPEHLGSCIAKLREIGMEVEEGDQSVTAYAAGRLRPTRVRTAMYPGFPTDLQQPLTALLTRIPGTSLVADRIYPKRYQHVPQLNRMGARIDVRSGVARIKGGTPLRGTLVHASDVRAGICLLVAALTAEGTTSIAGVRHIERGYENIAASFRALGADVTMRDTAEDADAFGLYTSLGS